MPGADVIRSLPHSNNGIRILEFDCVLLEVWTPVWMLVVWDTGRNDKITGNTDYTIIICLSYLSRHVYTNYVLQ